MAKEIKNRRENILINEIPPEILDKTSLEAALSTDGFVKNTDYPSASIAGVIKLNPNRAVSHANGALQSTVVTAENYEAMNNAAFVSKGTLENVIMLLVLGILNDLADVAAPSAEDGTVVSGLYAKRIDGEWTWAFGTITPPTT